MTMTPRDGDVGRGVGQSQWAAKLSTLLAMVAVTLGAFALAEMLARSLTWRSQVYDPRIQLRGYSAQALGDRSPRQRAVSINPMIWPFFVQINAQGFRNDEPLDADAVRVLVLGDSQTYGLFASNQDLWTAIAQRKWNAEHSPAVQLLNNGIPGSTIVDHRAYLSEKGKRLGPDIVLLVGYENDLADMGPLASSDRATRADLLLSSHPVPKSGWRRFLGLHSGMYEMARRLRLRLGKSARDGRLRPFVGVDSVQVPESDYRRELVGAIEDIRGLGAVPALAYIAAPNEWGDDGRSAVLRSCQEVAAAEGLPFLDLLPAYRGFAIYDVYNQDPVEGYGDYPSDSHLSRLGHRLTGYAIADFLRAVVPGGGKPG